MKLAPVLVFLASHWVFLASAFAQSPPDVTLVASEGGAPLADEMVIVITPDEVRVNLDVGCTVRHGDIPEDQRVSATSPIVPALQETIEEALAVDEMWSLRAADYRSRDAILVADRDTSYGVLTYTMMTASAAGVQEFAFATTAASWPQLGGEDRADGLKRAATYLCGRPVRILADRPSSGGEPSRTGLDDALEVMARYAADEHPVRSALSMRCLGEYGSTAALEALSALTSSETAVPAWATDGNEHTIGQIASEAIESIGSR